MRQPDLDMSGEHQAAWPRWDDDVDALHMELPHSKFLWETWRGKFLSASFRATLSGILAVSWPSQLSWVARAKPTAKRLTNLQSRHGSWSLSETTPFTSSPSMAWSSWWTTLLHKPIPSGQLIHASPNLGKPMYHLRTRIRECSRLPMWDDVDWQGWGHASQTPPQSPTASNNFSPPAAVATDSWRSRCLN